MNRKKVVLLLTLFALLSTAVTASALQSGGIAPAPINPDFVKYIEDVRSGKAANIIPPKPYLSSSQNTRNEKNSARSAPHEASFDLVQKGLVTPVKAQRGWGTCWDFATMEALESNLKKQTSKDYELSELHLGFFAYFDESDDKPAFDVLAKEGDNHIFDNGGFPRTSRAILSRGTGPVLDEHAPYPQNDYSDRDFWKTFPDDPNALRDELLKAPIAFRLKESLIFHNSDDIKQALKDHGGLWVAFNADRVAKHRDDPYLYISDDKSMSHAVMLVGWDDNLSRDLFIGPNSGYSSPDIDGGWKIQNSWGLSRDIDGNEVKMGDGGYYWISYADVSIFGDEGANSYIAMPADSYEHTYSHDPLGACYALEAPSNTSQTANVFTSERDEDLVYVGFDTEGHDIDYSIQVFRNIPAGGLPHEGEAFLSSPLTGTAEFPGYRTVKFTKPVPLNKGERFAVVVTLTSDENLQIPVEAKMSYTSLKANAGPGESYVRTDDNYEWDEVLKFDFSYTDTDGEPITFACTNLTIKVFTNSVKRDSSSGSSGCATGAFTLILIAVVPFVLRRR